MDEFIFWGLIIKYYRLNFLQTRLKGVLEGYYKVGSIWLDLEVVWQDFFSNFMVREVFDMKWEKGFFLKLIFSHLYIKLTKYSI